MLDTPTVSAAPGSGDRRVLVQFPPPAPMGLVLLPPHPRLDRVDRVEWQSRTGQVRVVTGTPGAVAPPPATDGWEPVALVRMPRGAAMVTAAQIVPVAPVARATYRTGRRNGRNLYLQAGVEASDGDVPVGMLDTPELARFAVDAMNAALARERGSGA